MQPVRDAQIVNLITQIGTHFRANISNRFLRPLLLQLPLDNESWDRIEKLMEKSDPFLYQGFPVKELYQQLAAVDRFVSLARHELSSSVKNRMIFLSSNGTDKVLRDMAINNLTSNVNVLSGMIDKLFISLVELDKADARDEIPLYQQIPGMDSLILRLLENPTKPS